MKNTTQFPVIADLNKLILPEKVLAQPDIVVHHSATPVGSARSFHDYHVNNNGWRALGYHFVINNGKRLGDLFDGMIQCNLARDWDKDFDFLEEQGAHAKGLNNCPGICVVGDFTDSFPTPNQILAVTALVTHLNYKREQFGHYPYQIIGHREAGGYGGALVSKSCPGENINCNFMRQYFASQQQHYLTNMLAYKDLALYNGNPYEDVIYYDTMV